MLGQVALQAIKQLPLGLLAGQAANLLQLLHVLGGKGFHLLRPPLQFVTAFLGLALDVFEAAFLLEQGLVFLLQGVLALGEAAFQFTQIGAALFGLALEFFPPTEKVVLGLQFGFLADAVGFVTGAADDCIGLAAERLAA